jgi:hypothetical protein
MSFSDVHFSIIYEGHYATQITVAPLLTRPKWRLMLYTESRAGGGRGRGQGGHMHGEIFFPLPSLDFSIDFAVKANWWRITFLHMEKGPLPEWKGFPPWKHRKRALGNGQNFQKPTNSCRLGAGKLQ